MAEIRRNDHIVFAFCLIFIKINETTDTFRKSQVLVGLFFFVFFQENYRTYIFEKGKNDCTGCSSVKNNFFSLRKQQNQRDNFAMVQSCIYKLIHLHK